MVNLSLIHSCCVIVASMALTTTESLAVKFDGAIRAHDEAIKAYDEAIRLDPNDADAWNNKSLVLEYFERTAEANTAFAKAKELGYTG